MDIKPIETAYNGYLFRSRLEARWAVFFDELGIKYEYEPEGFDLGEHGWYLPDFWLPENNIWVEIKPKNNQNQKRIYLAGKIWKNDWRHKIAHGIRDSGTNPWPYSLQCEESGHEITGPFFVSCDHGCAHGDGNHGCGETCMGDRFHTTEDRRRFVKDECLEAIRNSTDVFAWISSLDCYGTLIELGYAAALEKTINVAVDKSLSVDNDLWFLASLSNSYFHAETAIDAFNTYYPRSESAKKIQIVGDKMRSMAVLCEGDPLDHKRIGFAAAMFNFALSKGRNREQAAISARQARFEHGQVGSPKKWAV